MTSSLDHLVVECEQRRRLVSVAPAAMQSQDHDAITHI